MRGLKRLFAEPPRGIDKPSDVVRDIEQRQRFGGNTSLTKAEVFGAFGGVFGDVMRGMFGSQLTRRAAVDGLGIRAGSRIAVPDQGRRASLQ
jgi:hypothetical protein